jgi:hypothetical protein
VINSDEEQIEREVDQGHQNAIPLGMVNEYLGLINHIAQIKYSCIYFQVELEVHVAFN